MPEELDALIAGRYQLGRSLGVGGMAEVFEATDLRTGQQVAIKCLLPQHAAEPQLARRFLSEATRTQSLSRPYILKVLDSGQAAGAPFVIFELAQGGSLEDWLDDLQQALPPAVVIRLAHALASALEHAHAQGIIHQDLKPSNILFRCLPDPEQEEFDVALADFGQARTVALASMTGSSLMWGSPAYMAPEVLRGESADPRSDLFSLGVVMFEALSLRLPWNASTPMARLVANASAPELDCGNLGLELLVARLLELDRGRRPLSASAVAAALAGHGQLPPLSVAVACSACGAPKPADLRLCPACGSGALTREEALSSIKGKRQWSLILKSLDRDPETLDSLHALLHEITGLEDVSLNIDQTERSEGAGKKTGLPATLFENLSETEAKSLEARFCAAGLHVRSAKGWWGRARCVAANARGFLLTAPGLIWIAQLTTGSSRLLSWTWSSMGALYLGGLFGVAAFQGRKLTRVLFHLPTPTALPPPAHAALAQLRAWRALDCSPQLDDLLRQLAECVARLCSHWSANAPAEAWQSLHDLLAVVGQVVQRLVTMEASLRAENDADLVRAITMARHRGVASLTQAASAQQTQTLTALEQALSARQALFRRRDELISQLCLLVGHVDVLARNHTQPTAKVQLLESHAQDLIAKLAPDLDQAER